MFADIRTEWRVTDIERSLHGKADSYRLDETNGDVDRLERSLREISSVVDELRSQCEERESRVRELERQIQEIIT